LTLSELQYLESFSESFTYTPSDDKQKRKDEWDFFQKATNLKYLKNDLTNHPNGYIWKFKKTKNENSS
jgi:hypothetical protein